MTARTVGVAASELLTTTASLFRRLTVILQEATLLFSLSGLLVGMLVGMTGVGGGSLMAPLLIVGFGLHPESAVGTDLLYASATKSAGTTMHTIVGSVDWRLVRRLAFGSIPAAAITVAVLWNMGPASPAAASLIRFVLGIVLWFTAMTFFFRETLLRRRRSRLSGIASERTVLLTVLTGVVLGVVVSIASVGAGALGVSALSALYPRLPIAKVVGSDIAHAVPLTLVAGFGHSLFGSPNWLMLGSLLLGSIPGILIGSYFANRTAEVLVRYVLAVVLLAASIRLVLGA